MLKPGTYKLVRTIDNPQPDRRHKMDWRYAQRWEQDTEFLVVEHKRDFDDALEDAKLTDDQRAKLEARMYYTTIRLVGYRWTHHEIGPGDEARYAALEAWLMPIDETPDAMFTRLGIGNDYFVRWLVGSGALSPKLFEKLWAEYSEMEDAGQGAHTRLVEATETISDSETTEHNLRSRLAGVRNHVEALRDHFAPIPGFLDALARCVEGK